MFLPRLSLLALAASGATAAPAWYEAPLPTTTTTSAAPTQWFVADPTWSFAPASSSSASSTAASSSSSSTAASSSAAPSSTATATAKRGVGFNDAYLTKNLAISWAYSWQPTYSGGELNDGVEFVPMLWGKNDSNWFAEAEQGIANGATALLAANEPDIYSQSNLTVQEGIDLWRKNFSPFYGRANLVSPAVSNDPKSGSVGWLEQFFGNCTQCQQETHAAALHYYSDDGNTTALKAYFEDTYARLNKPIWITEFGYQKLTMTSGNVTAKQEFLEDVVPWMEQTPWIERYAAFGDFVNRFVWANASLTPLGETYNNAA
ncbi:hypothetical protein JCM8097_004206 [Rhodosporidiobolus ruineniae]